MFQNEKRDTTKQPASESFPSRKGRWILAASFVIAILATLAVFAFIGKSEICKIAVQKAQASAVVNDRLGTPVKQGFLMSGSIEITGPSGHADIAIPLSGPRGKGTLYAVATKSAAIWKFETLQLAVDGDANRLDLLFDKTGDIKPSER